VRFPVAAWAAALLVASGAAEPARAAEPPQAAPTPAPAGTCTAVYSGSARGTFRCRVTAEHHVAIGVSRIVLELEGDPSGDALAIRPGGLEWSGPLLSGTHASAEDGVSLAWSYLETGVPGQPFAFVASKAWASHPAPKGDVAVTLTRAVAGPVAAGVQRFEVHGTFSARLLPALPGAVSAGAVRVRATF